MTDTPTDGTDEPTEPTAPDHLAPPAAADAPATEPQTVETPPDATPPPVEVPPTAATPPPYEAPPTVEAPAMATAAPTAQVPLTAPVATAAPEKRRGVFVPWWALAVVAALVVFGGGLLIGHAVSDDGNGDRAVRATNPFGGNGGRIPNPFAGNGNGNGIPNPFGGNGGGGSGNGGGGNSNGNGNGNGGGASNTSTAFLGVGVANSTDPAGVRVVNVVASGPAAGAGLQQGDVITAVDGNAVANTAALRAAVSAHQPGDDVKVTYTRSGSEKTVTVSLGDRTSLSQ
jgi:membrane-associated protease RseP (regulator of RpoE activity)